MFETHICASYTIWLCESHVLLTLHFNTAASRLQIATLTSVDFLAARSGARTCMLELEQKTNYVPHKRLSLTIPPTFTITFAHGGAKFRIGLVTYCIEWRPWTCGGRVCCLADIVQLVIPVKVVLIELQVYIAPWIMCQIRLVSLTWRRRQREVRASCGQGRLSGLVLSRHLRQFRKAAIVLHQSSHLHHEPLSAEVGSCESLICITRVRIGQH